MDDPLDPGTPVTRDEEYFLRFLNHDVDVELLALDPDVARRALLALRPSKPPTDPTQYAAEMIRELHATYLRAFRRAE